MLGVTEFFFAWMLACIFLLWSHYCVCFNCARDFDSVYRGFALWLSLERGDVLPAVRTNFSDNASFCYTLLENNSQFSKLYSAMRLWHQADTSGTVILMTDEYSFALCDEPSGLRIPVPTDTSDYHRLLDSGIRGSFYRNLGDDKRVTEELERLQGILVPRAFEETSSGPPTEVRFAFDCSVDYSGILHMRGNSLRAHALLFSLKYVIGIFLETICMISFEPELDLTIPEVGCPPEVIQSALDYLYNAEGFVLPPVSIGDCPDLLKLPEPTTPETPTFMSNTSFLDPATEILSLSPVFLASNILSSALSPTSCPTSSPYAVLECEEIPSFLCSAYQGCYIAWGPCQTVSLGFYSPSGSTSQTPCPRLPEDQFSIPGSSSDACLTACKDPKLILINGTCVSPAPGEITVSDCNGTNAIIACDPEIDGSLYTESGSCAGRYLAVAFGGYKAVNADYLTIETWIRVNSVTMNSIIPVYGMFGSCFIGLEYIDSESISIVLFVASENGAYTVRSDRVEHFTRSRWTHIAATVDRGSVLFYLNAKLVGTAQTKVGETKSITALMSLFLTPAVSSQLLTYVNREHFGPFRLTESDLAGSSPVNPWRAYITTTFVDMDLFHPQIQNDVVDIYESDYFSHAPEGMREIDTLSYSMMLGNNECPNKCLSDPKACHQGCGEDIWDPFTCRCTRKEVYCTTTSTSSAPTTTLTFTATESSTGEKTTEIQIFTSSSSTAKTETFSDPTSSKLCMTTSTSSTTQFADTTAPYSNSSDVVAVLILCGLALLGLGYFLRRRRAQRVSSDHSEIHGVADTQWIQEINSDRPFIQSSNYKCFSVFIQ